MRWEELFADLEARFAAAAADELNAEVADRIRSEAARVGAAERLAVAVGSTVRVVALGGASASGTVRRSGPDWLLLAESYGADVLVLLSAVAAVTGVPRGWPDRAAAEPLAPGSDSGPHCARSRGTGYRWSWTWWTGPPAAGRSNESVETTWSSPTP